MPSLFHRKKTPPPIEEKEWDYDVHEFITPQVFNIQSTGSTWRPKYTFWGPPTLGGTKDVRPVAWTGTLHSKSLELIRGDGMVAAVAKFESIWHGGEAEIELTQHKSGFKMSRNKGAYNATQGWSFRGETFTWRRIAAETIIWEMVSDKNDRIEISMVSQNIRTFDKLLNIKREGLDVEMVEAIMISALYVIEYEMRMAAVNTGAATAGSTGYSVALGT